MPATKPPSPVTADRLARALDRLGLARGGDGIGVSGLRTFMGLPERDGVFDDADLIRVYADLTAINRFKATGYKRLKARFPGFISDFGKGGLINWRYAFRFDVSPDGPVSVRLEVPLPRRDRDFLDGMARKLDPEADHDAVGARLEAILATVMSGLEPKLAKWRKRYSDGQAASGRRAGEFRHIVAGVARSNSVGASLEDAPKSVISMLDRCMRSAAKDMERRKADDVLRSALGYEGFVDRMKASRPPRRVVFHLGPTNSGKTYDAMRDLAAAPTGAYLAPLRLLALEGHELLKGLGVRSGMVTGEESIDADDATHLSQTVETAILGRRFDTVVVDEIQMLLDTDRGWAWTRAVFGMDCGTLILAGSEDALPLVLKATEILGETVEVVRHVRKAPLTVEASPIGYQGIRAGDALIAFSRRDVYLHREVLINMGHRVATVYGALSPEVRRAEAARFTAGDADVLVATDAIGMGLNLGPLRRIVFAATDKFDGHSRRPLLPSEIRQVAGRAGRFGHHQAGYVTVLDGSLKRVTKALDGEVDPGTPDGLFSVRPDMTQIRIAADELGTDLLVPTLKAFRFKTVYDGSPFKPCDLDDTIEAAAQVDYLPMSLEDKFAFACCPIDSRDDRARWSLRRFADAHAAGRPAHLPPVGRANQMDDEGAVKLMTAYLWLARRYPDTFVDVEGAMAEKARANADIEASLRESAHRKAGGRSGPRAQSASRR